MSIFCITKRPRIVETVSRRGNQVKPRGFVENQPETDRLTCNVTVRRHQTASLLFCRDVDIYACFVTEIHLLCQDDEEEGIVVYPGSPTSTKSLSPRRLQKMRRV